MTKNFWSSTAPNIILQNTLVNTHHVCLSGGAYARLRGAAFLAHPSVPFLRISEPGECHFEAVDKPASLRLTVVSRSSMSISPRTALTSGDVPSNAKPLCFRTAPANRAENRWSITSTFLWEGQRETYFRRRQRR